MTATTVHTVLGPVPAADLGVVAVHEALLSVLPGAQYGYDVEIDRAAVLRTLADRLHAFRVAGGGTVVDAGGMFAGRDVPLYEALSRATGVHIVASSGQMEEGMLGGYFLTPQTEPPTQLLRIGLQGWQPQGALGLRVAGLDLDAAAGLFSQRCRMHRPAGLLKFLF